jgi:hypothetical protein
MRLIGWLVGCLRRATVRSLEIAADRPPTADKEAA